MILKIFKNKKNLGYRGAIQVDGCEVYNSFVNSPWKMILSCWAHVRRKFVEALEEENKHASEAIMYISKLYKIDSEMKEAGLDAVAKYFTGKSRMGEAKLGA